MSTRTPGITTPAEPPSPESMHRRRALQYLGGALALPVLARLGSDDLFGAGHALHASLDMGDGAYIFRTLDTRQRRTLMAMVDQIIPDTDTPGALSARVHEFVDLVLTEFAQDAERRDFLRGLAELDARSASVHARPFDECEGAQQLALLETLQAEAAEAPEDVEPEPFLYRAKSLTLWGYYTSEIGMTQEVRYELIPGTLPGCDAG